MLEVQKSLLFKEISQNHIRPAIELLNKEPKLILSTTKYEKNIFHILLENKHISSFQQLFSSIPQYYRRILFTRSDIFEQNVLHYAAKYATPLIFRLIVIDLWEYAPCTAKQISQHGYTPLKLTQHNKTFKTLDPSEKDAFIILANTQVNLDWYREKLKIIHTFGFNAKKFPIDFFSDHFKSNILHGIAMYADPITAIATILLLGNYSKKLARSVNNFGYIPLMLTKLNPFSNERVDTILANTTISLAHAKKTFYDRMLKSIFLFLDMLCADQLSNEQKNKISHEIISIADKMHNYRDLDKLINTSTFFKKLHNVNFQLLKNIIVSVKVNYIIKNLDLESSTNTHYNNLAEKNKTEITESINFFRTRKTFYNSFEKILHLWKLYSSNINEINSKKVFYSLQYKKANCAENTIIAAKALEILQYDQPFAKIKADKGDHSTIGLSVTHNTQINNYKECSTSIVILDTHNQSFFPIYYLPQKLKTHIYYPTKRSNINCSFNPEYHTLKVDTLFFKINRINNPHISDVKKRLVAIINLLDFLDIEFSNKASAEFYTSEKKKMVSNYKKLAEETVTSIDDTYQYPLTEHELDQHNQKINYFLLALFRITQCPIIAIYPRNHFTYTHWNEKLQPHLTTLKVIRQKLEEKLLILGESWQKNCPISKDDKVTQDEPVKQSANSMTH